MLTFFSSLTPPPSFSSASSHLSLPLHLISHPSLGLCLLATAAMLMQVDAVHIKNCCLLHLSKKPLDPRTLWSAPYRSGSVKWGPLKVETMERERERDIMKDWEKASRTADLIVFCCVPALRWLWKISHKTPHSQSAECVSGEKCCSLSWIWTRLCTRSQCVRKTPPAALFES